MMIYGYVQNVRHEIMRHAHHARNIAYWSLMYQDKERVKKCRDKPQKSCKACHCMIAAGCADLCDDCYWHQNLWNKFDQNQKYLSLVT